MERTLFVDIGSGEQTAILREIKKHSDITWDKIAEVLCVNRSMVFRYLRESSRIKFSNLIKLCDYMDFSTDRLDSLVLVKLKHYDSVEIIMPKLDENLAEFLGAMAGDGNIYGKNYAVTITCGAIVDYNYITEVVRKMFEDLFNVHPKIVSSNGKIQCKVYSKELTNFLSEEMSFPIGNRKNRTFIPKIILNETKLLCAYLRGMFDTDGSFHRKRPNSGVVEYISCSPNFLNEIKEALISLGFKASLSGKSVYIYDQGQLDTFFKVIKPSNIKHTIKYQVFKETGKVPTHKEFVNASVV